MPGPIPFHLTDKAREQLAEGRRDRSHFPYDCHDCGRPCRAVFCGRCLEMS
jgi:hypothetical protein